MREIRIGDQVALRGTVVHSTMTEHRPEEYHTITVQLADGQGVQTNVRNVHEPVAVFDSRPDSKPNSARNTAKTEKAKQSEKAE